MLNCNFYIYRLDSISRYRLKGDGKMKIEKSYSESGKTTCVGDEFNAVCLSEGYIGTKVHFRPDEKVILIDDVTLVLN